MYCVTLAVDRRATTLPSGVIAAVQDAACGLRVSDLAAGEAVDIVADAMPDAARVAQALDGFPADAIVTPVAARRKKLLIADMDSTIVTGETLDELAAYAGLKWRIAEITSRSMNGEIDFAEALRLRVAMLEGLPTTALEETWRRTTVSTGARELVATMRRHGARTALVSGGFTFFTSRVATMLGFDVHRANTLAIENGRLTGRVVEPILDRDAKLATLSKAAAERGIGLPDTLAVGDGANDLAMLRAAGLGVAYRAKPVVTRETRARIEHSTLRTLLFAQGYRASEFSGGG
ncbi:MAG: phosphoserine phosphatase SerB [Acidisphaera sp.]|nr:phosphoserine phosphatase SerB [Acidisphaera sp.]